MENRRFKIHNLIAVICAVVISCVIVLGQLTVSMAYAAENAEVLTDLHRDSSFSESDYPYAPERTDLEVITIAEGEGEQLFIYVYNPSMNDKFNATYIRLSQTIGENYAPDDYGLGLVSYSGVFQKYYVKNLTLKQTTQRYYNITCIFRKFIEGIDRDCETETKNNVEQVVFEVALCFTAETHSGNVSYTCEGVEVVKILDKYCATYKLPDGIEWYWVVAKDHSTYEHIIAFNTDWDIEKLYEADISWWSQSYEYNYDDNIETLGEVVKNPPITIYGQDENGNDVTVSNSANWWFGHTYTFTRIQSGASFLQEVENEGKNIKAVGNYLRDYVANKQWVIIFTETECVETWVYRQQTPPPGISAILPPVYVHTKDEGTLISNETILRLKFKTSVGVKNLGVVDNYQTGSNEAIFEGKDELEIFADKLNEFWELFIKVVGLIVLVIVLIVLLNFVTPVLSVLKFLFKGIVFVITMPFKLLKRIFKKSG